MFKCNCLKKELYILLESNHLLSYKMIFDRYLAMVSKYSLAQDARIGKFILVNMIQEGCDCICNVLQPIRQHLLNIIGVE